MGDFNNYWTLEDVLDSTKKEAKELILFLVKKELLCDFSGDCTVCDRGEFRLASDSPGCYMWRCTSCKKKVSAKTGSFFEGSHISFKQVLVIIYCFSWKLPHDFSRVQARVAGRTLTDWNNFCREVGTIRLQREQDEGNKIGGPGAIVEVGTSKCGRRKFFRGLRIDGQWVFGGVARDDKSHFFMQIVPDKSAETLIPIIKANVKAGTTIISECSEAYAGLEGEGYIHQTVEQRVGFVDSETGAHNNTIKSTWGAVKKAVNNSREQFFEAHLWEYLFRRKYMNVDQVDPYKAFIDCVKKVYDVRNRMDFL